MSRNHKHRIMVQVIKEADLSQNELIDILAMFMSDSDPEKVSEWFREMKERRLDLEQRMDALLKEMNERELHRFDPVI